MNQVKIGTFIRELRKERELTQEELAEQFHVTRRTVSRWETGSNLPDLDILIEMSDYFQVELRELLDGERKSKEINEKLEETVLKVAEYSNEDKLKVVRRMHLLFIGGIFAAFIYLILAFTNYTNDFLDFLKGMCFGIQWGLIIMGAITTSKYAAKIKMCKKENFK